MSIVQLSSIRVSRRSANPDFYVAGLADTYSGYPYPVLITERADIDSFFGEFKYADMYKALISNDIPVLLLSKVTRLSEFNKSSIRINDGPIRFCHPKYGKDYRSQELGKIFSWEYTNVTTFSFAHGLGYNPRILILGGIPLEEVVPEVFYVDKNNITINFSKPTTGSVHLEVIDNVGSFIKEFTLVDEITTIPLDSNTLPEIVAVDSENRLVEVGATLSGGSLIVTRSGPEEVFLTIRDTPQRYLISEFVRRTSGYILHDLNHYPIFTLRDVVSGDQVDVGVEYPDKDRAVLRSNAVPDFNATYNLIISGDSFDFKSIYSGHYSFNHILDFTDVLDNTYDNPRIYFIVEINRTRYLFYWDDIPIERTYYDVDFKVIGTTPEEMLESIKSTLSGILGSEKCTNIYDRLLAYVDRFTSENEFIEPTTHKRYFEELINNSFGTDFWVNSNQDVADYLSTMIEPISAYYDSKIDPESPDYDPSFVIDTTRIISDLHSGLIDLRDSGQLNTRRILLEYYLPTTNINFYYLPGFKIDSDMNLNDDSLCELTENVKLCEFYSKIKGEAGRNITIKIDKLPNTDYRYRITISLGDIQEIYHVVTNGGAIDPNSPLRSDTVFIRLQDISAISRLVDAKLFDYILESGELIDQLDFDDRKAPGELFSPRYDPDEGYNSGVIAVELLKVGELTEMFTLDRTFNEISTMEDYFSTLQILKDSDYWPDFLMIDNLNFGTNNLSYLDNRFPYDTDKHASTSILDYSKTKFTQALIRLDDSHLTIRDLPNEESRMLYFYKDIDINDTVYNCAYPYVLNMINSEYLRILGFSLIYKISQEKESELTSKFINYLLYNNLYYHYRDYVDTNPDPNFVIRFITSKISRSFMINEGRLINCEPSEITSTINSIIWRVLSVVPLIRYINFGYVLTENTLRISLETQVKGISNRVYRLDFTLNL